MFTQIKGNARLLLRAGGAQAVSLRGIAREIGITPPAIYRYYPNLQALIDALHDDILGELVTLIQVVRDQHPEECGTIRLAEMARTFRWWSLDHPAEFRLAFGSDSAGPAEHVSASGPRAIQFPRLVAVFLDEFVRLRQHAQAEASTLDVPLPAIFSFASAWAKLYGLVAMEISGQVPWPRAMTDTFFEAEIAAFGQPPDNG